MQASLIPRRSASETEPWSVGADSHNPPTADCGKGHDSGETSPRSEISNSCELRRRFARAADGFRRAVSDDSIVELRESIESIRRRVEPVKATAPTRIAQTVGCRELPEELS